MSLIVHQTTALDLGVLVLESISLKLTVDFHVTYCKCSLVPELLKYVFFPLLAK